MGSAKPKISVKSEPNEGVQDPIKDLKVLRASRRYSAKRVTDYPLINSTKINNIVKNQLSRDTSKTSGEFTNHENLDNFGLDNNQLSQFLVSLE
jgi:hypothetical protein